MSGDTQVWVADEPGSPPIIHITSAMAAHPSAPLDAIYALCWTTFEWNGTAREAPLGSVTCPHCLASTKKKEGTA